MAKESSHPRPKNVRLQMRISRDQRRLLQRAADLQGRSLTDFVIGCAEEAAVRTIQETRVIRLTPRDSRIFAEALLNPLPPNPALRRAYRRYKTLIDS
jgi:uncharacterized protein (DUF1778 family)